jgi:hypothetical protein
MADPELERLVQAVVTLAKSVERSARDIKQLVREIERRLDAEPKEAERERHDRDPVAA